VESQESWLSTPPEGQSCRKHDFVGTSSPGRYDVRDVTTTFSEVHIDANYTARRQLRDVVAGVQETAVGFICALRAGCVATE